MRASGYERAAADWYVEPAWAVDALLQVERPFVGTVVDPCCGAGNIPARLRLAGVEAGGSDLIHRGFGGAFGIDFLQVPLPASSYVMNPPYGLAQEFVTRALEQAKDRVCALLRLSFLEGQARRVWHESKPLARVWVSSRRMSMPPGGSDVPPVGGTIAYAWFVWELGHRGPAAIGWI